MGTVWVSYREVRLAVGARHGAGWQGCWCRFRFVGREGRYGRALARRHRRGTKPPALHAEEIAELARGVELGDAADVGPQVDHVATLLVGSEVRPHTGRGVDLERSRPVVCAVGVDRDQFVPLPACVRQEMTNYVFDGAPRGAADGVEI